MRPPVWLLLLGALLLPNLRFLTEAQQDTGEGSEDELASCAQRCEEEYFPGKPCYCNPACAQYENCCYDYYPECQPDFVWSEEWFEYERHEYKYFSDGSITADGARKRCMAHGAQLVSINSEEEQNFIEYSVVKKRTLSAFIGGSDGEQEGTWQWADGSHMVLPSDPWGRWYEGEPDDYNSAEDCSVVTNYKYWSIRKQILSSYVWRDYNCMSNPANEIQGYICERTLACFPNPCSNNGSCLYIGGTEELECQCPSPYVGDICQYEVIEGEPWTECGETNLTDDTGFIKSPLYRKPYPNNADCRWLIESQGDLAISLRLGALDLEWGKDCDFDRLAIYDGDSSEDPLLLPPTCGTLDDKAGLELTSSGNKVLVVFTSDHSVQNTGFLLQYHHQQCGVGTGESGCGTKQLFTSDCGELSINQGPPVGEQCLWYIRVPAGRIIQMSFTHFHVEDTGLDCKDGFIAVYDGPDSNSPQLGRYCGWRFPWRIYSSTNEIHIRAMGLKWDSADYSIEIGYESLDPAIHQVLGPQTELKGRQGHFSSATSSVHARALDMDVYKWLVIVPIGDFAEITWTLQTNDDATLRIYHGVSEESGTLVSLDLFKSGKLNVTEGKTSASSFQMLVVFTRRRSSQLTTFEAVYKSIDWLPVESGCYRPHYFHNTTSKGTENNVVTESEPVTILISENSYSTVEPGYDAGMYCKWLIRASKDTRLSLDILGALLQPLDAQCGYDGLVVYDGENTLASRQGPFCGSTDLKDRSIVTTSNKMLVVFYSDGRGGVRSNGILRALVRTAESSTCPIRYMTKDVYTNTLVETCGVLMSPRFPGLVQPGLWSWVLQAPPDTHFILYVYYVTGPAVVSEDNLCERYFAVIEISRDALTLRQYETNMLKVCEDTGLFVPPKRLKSPPHSKVAIELNTLSNTISQLWEFKLSYTVSTLDKPKYLNESRLNDRSLCPENYQYFLGHCYRYYQWVLRHYLPEQYTFQQSWQRALAQCEEENATLVSIHSEDELYFLKYMMAFDWYWDPAATYQINHRLIYIGLHNRYGHYEWTDGSQLNYADWYRPPSSWGQPAVHEDTLVMDLLNLKSPQPNADVGSLCTVMMVSSPYGSSNWAKIPCDYPVFRAGLLCKRPAFHNIEDQLVNVSTPLDEVTKSHQSPSEMCPDGWVMVNGRCLLLHSYYRPSNSSNDTIFNNFERNMTYGVAVETCQGMEGDVARLSPEDFATVVRYLQLWHHGPGRGRIWLNSDVLSDSCTSINIFATHSLDESFHYEIMQESCFKGYEMGAVMCERPSNVSQESCGKHEFQCADSVCVLLDHVCDGITDCWDGSDELNCECDEGTFQCKSGRCISVSLHCDFKNQCGDNSDEENCVLEECGSQHFECHNGECIAKEKKCDFHDDCVDGSDELDDVCENECSGFLCYSGRCLPNSTRLDLVSDCPGLSFEDEREVGKDVELTLFQVYQQNVDYETQVLYDGCVEGGSFTQCHELQRKCYSRSATCVYDTTIVDEGDDYEIQTSCRDGAHLRTDCAEVQCPGMFHCPGSYCVPYRKLCNGIKDCPEGHDEMNCQEYTCPGLFRCKGSSYCLPHKELCDGTAQCTLEREDEKYCGEIDILCKDCDCRGHSAFCEHRGLNLLPTPQTGSLGRTLRSIQLAHNRLQLTNGSFSKLHWLTQLNISHNHLVQLPVGVFKDLKNLIDLDISGNRLAFLEPQTFDGLLSLRKLNLGDNMLRGLERAALPYLSPIQHLILTDNLLDNLGTGVFDDLIYLTHLDTDAFKFCCLAKHVEKCTPEADEFSSCEDLMANYALQVSIWVLGFCAFVGNFFVVSWRIITERRRMKVSSFFILNLGCSDFLMGVYMLIIASVDVHYRGVYIVHADSWRASGLCQFAGVLAMVSSEVSVFMLTAITVDRAMAILFPLKMGRVRLRHAFIVAIAGWTFALFMSILPTSQISYFGDAYFGTTGVCLPFVVSNERLPGWEYSVFIFLVINLVSFIIIFAGYIAIFSTVKSSMREMGSQSTNAIDEYALARKLVIIVATDFVCWVPIIIIGFAALGGAKIAPEVSAWIAVFILPLNSSLNPVLYTISAIDCGKKKKRSQMSMSTSLPGPRHTKMTTISESTPGYERGMADTKTTLDTTDGSKV